MIRTTLAALAVLIPLAALAEGGPTVRDAYVRSSNPMAAAAFMVIENGGDTDCRLVDTKSAAAQRVELHANVEQDGVMRMVPLDAVSIPAGGEHALQRGGDHVMMMGLTRPLAQGDVVSLDLDFGECGTRKIEAVVDNARAAEAMPAGMRH